MKPVATRDVVAFYPAVSTRNRISQKGRVTFCVVYDHIFNIEFDPAIGRFARGIEIAGHFGLAINGDWMTRELFETDAKHRVTKGHLRILMHKPSCIKPLSYTSFAHKTNKAAL